MRLLPELHLHLDGSLRSSTVTELAAKLGLAVPSALPFTPGMGLAAALERFDFTLSLLQTPDAVARVASEICEDAHASGVSTLEIRFAPQLHRGAPLASIVDAALEGAAGRAGIILCGLYGESPDVLDALVDLALPRRGVVGLDLAGGPTPAHAFRLADYQRPFARAARAGLGRTVHAAEGRAPEEIRVAIEILGAQRIGHGTTLLEDSSVLDLVLRRDVVVEACPTSNVHTGVISTFDAHPLPRWLQAGVRATLCADNTLLSAVTTRQEWERATKLPGLTPELLARAAEHGHAAAFHRA